MRFRPLDPEEFVYRLLVKLIFIYLTVDKNNFHYLFITTKSSPFRVWCFVLGSYINANLQFFPLAVVQCKIITIFFFGHFAGSEQRIFRPHPGTKDSWEKWTRLHRGGHKGRQGRPYWYAGWYQQVGLTSRRPLWPSKADCRRLCLQLTDKRQQTLKLNQEIENLFLIDDRYNN